MMKIFAYTKGAKLAKSVIEKLAQAGYIPVPVDSLDCVRVLEPVGDAVNAILFAAAIETIRGESYSDVKKAFANNVLKRIQPEAKANNKQKE